MRQVLWSWDLVVLKVIPMQICWHEVSESVLYFQQTARLNVARSSVEGGPSDAPRTFDLEDGPMRIEVKLGYRVATMRCGRSQAFPRNFKRVGAAHSAETVRSLQ
jgi:hypothetical protein